MPGLLRLWFAPWALGCLATIALETFWLQQTQGKTAPLLLSELLWQPFGAMMAFTGLLMLATGARVGKAGVGWSRAIAAICVVGGASTVVSWGIEEAARGLGVQFIRWLGLLDGRSQDGQAVYIMLAFRWAGQLGQVLIGLLGAALTVEAFQTGRIGLGAVRQLRSAPLRLLAIAIGVGLVTSAMEWASGQVLSRIGLAAWSPAYAFDRRYDFLPQAVEFVKGAPAWFLGSAFWIVVVDETFRAVSGQPLKPCRD